MEMNRKELRKLSHSFNTISNRMMRVVYEEFADVLIKFINFIESSEVIIDYIYLGEQKDYNVEAQWERVSSGESGFKFGPTMEDESFQIYSLLKYLADEENKISIRCFYNIYRHKKWQDNIKEFNDRVVLVLINNINDYLARIGIDMGLNENNVWNISGGQVNIANDEGTIYATQNNGFDSNELNRMVNNILDNIKDLECEDKEVVEETVQTIRDELLEQKPKRNVINMGVKLLKNTMIAIKSFPEVATSVQEFIDFVGNYL